MLSELATKKELEKILTEDNVFRPFPFPLYGERDEWVSLPEKVRNYFGESAQNLKGRQYPVLPASLYIDFTRTGNRADYESLSFSRRGDLMTLTIAECIEGEGEYIDSIINLVWAICEETSWVIPAHNNKGELPDIEYETFIDLFSAETGALFAWVYYFLGDVISKTSPTVKRRMEIEVERRILTPYLTYDHFWWMGLNGSHVNNWNPWINSNVLPAFLLFENNRERLIRGIEKTAKSTDKFIESYNEDGACDEGPGYFSAAGAVMFDYLEILYNISGGRINIYNNETIKNIARYIYRVHIDGKYFVNFADSSPSTGVAARHMARVGAAIGDDDLIGFAQKFDERGHGDITGNMKYRALRNLFQREEIERKSFSPPSEYWFKDTEILVMRDAVQTESGRTDTGMFIAVKGGHNDESHNHNDVGNFILYMNGKPVIVDAGVETYTRQTFSSERYKIWTMQSCYHNLPTINGYDQLNGRSRCSADVKYDRSDDITTLSMELKNAYPKEANIDSYIRKYIFERGKSFKVCDRYSLKQAGKPVTSNILCAYKPDITDTAIKLNENIEIIYDSCAFDVSCDEIELTDQRLQHNWGLKSLYRLRLTEKSVNENGSFSIEFAVNIIL